MLTDTPLQPLQKAGLVPQPHFPPSVSRPSSLTRQTVTPTLIWSSHQSQEIFKKLTSFGTLENVLQTIVPKRGKDIEGDLISTRTDTEKNAYVIEYTITSKGVKRHLLTVFSLQPGRYLLTLTGQALEDNWASSEPVLRAVTESYKLRILN
ncbi:hypothetical protein BWQ96_03059 [Gracilariopsis chorda]|uniref:PsbP C-terminal domain-containing protein n=1 Tax=Gracilariopsis chorda TaxID=448386 RepID=A0A2V3IZK7_9FLOR|nr:hypothetical protein BWQ96_03059 [Gracilariopsis chorda]|eukprot:PXF47117.1 hypothetical protein BWQ96_03059 [Gracilariopsis chorda]